MNQLNTTLPSPVINETYIRGKAMANLIKLYLPGMNMHYGYRSIGTNPSIPFPAFFVQPKMKKADLYSTAKFRMYFTYGLYWYIRDSSSEEACAQASWVGEYLEKLFSNNALGDLQIANPATNKFYQYPGFWLEAVMNDWRLSVNYLDPDPKGPRYECAGRMLIRIMDVVLK